MSKVWHCGDCGTEYPKSVHFCNRFFDDYVALRGGTIESAINRAVDRAIAPLVDSALRRLRPQYTYTVGPTIIIPIRYND